MIEKIGIDPAVCDFCDEPTYSVLHLPAADMHLCMDHGQAFTKAGSRGRGHWVERLRKLYAAFA